MQTAMKIFRFSFRCYAGDSYVFVVVSGSHDEDISRTERNPDYWRLRRSSETDHSLGPQLPWDQ